MYHARAASLVWILEKTSTHHQVESIIAETLTSPRGPDSEASYHAFGNLWRLTGSPLSHVTVSGTVIDASLRGQQPPRLLVESPADDHFGDSEER
jgi:hypothetical protein